MTNTAPWVVASALLVAACASVVGLPDVPNPGDGDGGSDLGSSGDTGAGQDGLSPPNNAPEADDSTMDSSSSGSSSGDLSVRDSSMTDDGCSSGTCLDASCPSNEVSCGTTCWDLTMSGTNCGKCGHDCGGGACVDSACQPQPLVTGIDAPTGFAIDSTSIYFSVDDTLKKCALSGCSTGTTQLASYAAMHLVEVANGNVTFVGTPSVGNHPAPTLFASPTSGGGAAAAVIQSASNSGNFLQTLAVGADLYFLFQYSLGYLPSSDMERCVGVSGTGSGCANLVSIGGFEATTPIAADANNMYFVSEADDGGVSFGVNSCPNGGACSAPQLVDGSDFPTQMAAYGGMLYLTTGARDLNTGGNLYSCPVTGGGGCTSLDRVQVEATSLTADADGIYFTSSQDVYTCPLAGCGIAGPVPIATGYLSAAMIRTDTKFVYWVDQGADGGVDAASIVRVAK
jgi:hypothetical protein